MHACVRSGISTERQGDKYKMKGGPKMKRLCRPPDAECRRRLDLRNLRINTNLDVEDVDIDLQRDRGNLNNSTMVC